MKPYTCNIIACMGIRREPPQGVDVKVVRLTIHLEIRHPQRIKIKLLESKMPVELNVNNLPSQYVRAHSKNGDVLATS